MATHVKTKMWFASASQLPIIGPGQSHKTRAIQQVTVLALRKESGKEEEEEWAKMMKTLFYSESLLTAPRPKPKASSHLVMTS